jgi:hypothetical protein
MTAMQHLPPQTSLKLRVPSKTASGRTDRRITLQKEGIHLNGVCIKAPYHIYSTTPTYPNPNGLPARISRTDHAPRLGLGRRAVEDPVGDLAEDNLLVHRLAVGCWEGSGVERGWGGGLVANWHDGCWRGNEWSEG